MGKEKTTILKIDANKCKGCLLCIDVCPQKVLEMSKKVNEKGLQYVIIKDPDKCTCCGLCTMMCPDCALEIIEKEK